MNYDMIKTQIEQSEFVLVGLGKELRDSGDNSCALLQAYNQLEQMIKGKPYFIVTENEDTKILESKLLDFFVMAPFMEGDHLQNSEEQWNSYLNWLTATLNHKLCILELGVGFASPQVIRWPFEKTAEYNLKSYFIRINDKFPQLPKEIAERGLSVKSNALEFLNNYYTENCVEDRNQD